MTHGQSSQLWLLGSIGCWWDWLAVSCSPWVPDEGGRGAARHFGMNSGALCALTD